MQVMNIKQLCYPTCLQKDLNCFVLTRNWMVEDSRLLNRGQPAALGYEKNKQMATFPCKVKNKTKTMKTGRNKRSQQGCCNQLTAEPSQLLAMSRCHTTRTRQEELHTLPVAVLDEKVFNICLVTFTSAWGPDWDLTNCYFWSKETILLASHPPNPAEFHSWQGTVRL